MGLDYDELFPGRFLKSGQFKGKDVTLTIANVTVEKLPQDNGKPRGRGIISFKQTEMELVLNRTNGECLKAMFGRDTGNWIGKRVTFFPAQIEAFGGQELAIRVRGSPELAQDIQVEVQLPRKRPFRVTLKRTGKVSVSKATPEPAPETFNPETGEVSEANGHAAPASDEAPF